MTLRFNDRGKPVGLDWSVCNDGTSNPDIWGMKPKAPAKRSEPLESHSRQRLTPGVERQVIRLYGEQKSALEISRELGIASASVFKILRRNDVPTRSKSEGMRISRERRSA